MPPTGPENIPWLGSFFQLLIAVVQLATLIYVHHVHADVHVVNGVHLHDSDQ